MSIFFFHDTGNIPQQLQNDIGNIGGWVDDGDNREDT
jgi:hypothetical protein